MAWAKNIDVISGNCGLMMNTNDCIIEEIGLNADHRFNVT